MATKLALYNAALVELGMRPLANLTEEVESRRLLDTVYTNVVDDCLSEGSWNFATETVKLDADTGVTPNFGYQEVFAKPSDWVRTVAVSGDEDFSAPLTQYYDDFNFWSSNITPIYVRYVSSDTGAGYDLNRWPTKFRRYVELSLAQRVAAKLTQSDAIRDSIISDTDKAKKKALSEDAMNEPNPKFPPMGSWNTSRLSSTSYHRGRRNRLTG